MPDLGVWGQFGRITDKEPEGTMIHLTCKHHPNLRWMTKNIAPIGARSLFFDNYRINEKGTIEFITECTCPIEDLIYVEA